MKEKTILDFLERRAADFPNATAHWTLAVDGNWHPTTWESYLKTVYALAHGIQKLGLKVGQHVAIMMPTSQIWDYLQMAILACGGIIVGIDPHDLPENINSISSRVGVDALVIQSNENLSSFSKEVLDSVQFVISADVVASDSYGEKLTPYKELIEENSDSPKHLNLPDENDSATIIFTSGTTGEPKGILYSHGQVVEACRTIIDTYSDIKQNSRLVCWLPLSNLFQRIINYCAICIGAETYYVDEPRKIMEFLQEISPHIFIAVPRFFEKLQEGIQYHFDGSYPLIQKTVNIALSIGKKHASALREKRTPPFFVRHAFKFADRLVLQRMRSLMGHNIKYMISGSAPMSKQLLEWYHSIGLLVLEAYGTSENIIPNTANNPDDYRFGTVGKPLPGNEIRISTDGEFLVKGPGVFGGYFGEKKKSPLTPDGFLETGDYAFIDSDGYITITGRKSDIFKTSTGRRIAPNSIEELLHKASYVEHAVVVGAGRKFLTAVLSISIQKLIKKIHGSKPGNEELKIRLNETMRNVIQKDVFKLTKSLPTYQQPAGVLVTSEPFSVTGKELTSNLKVRRKNVERKYLTQIDMLYLEIDQMKSSGKNPKENLPVRET